MSNFLLAIRLRYLLFYRELIPAARTDLWQSLFSAYAAIVGLVLLTTTVFLSVINVEVEALRVQQQLQQSQKSPFSAVWFRGSDVRDFVALQHETVSEDKPLLDLANTVFFSERNLTVLNQQQKPVNRLRLLALPINTNTLINNNQQRVQQLIRNAVPKHCNFDNKMGLIVTSEQLKRLGYNTAPSSLTLITTMRSASGRDKQQLQLPILCVADALPGADFIVSYASYARLKTWLKPQAHNKTDRYKVNFDFSFAKPTTAINQLAAWGECLQQRSRCRELSQKLNQRLSDISPEINAPLSQRLRISSSRNSAAQSLKITAYGPYGEAGLVNSLSLAFSCEDESYCLNPQQQQILLGNIRDQENNIEQYQGLTDDQINNQPQALQGLIKQAQRYAHGGMIVPLNNALKTQPMQAKQWVEDLFFAWGSEKAKVRIDNGAINNLALLWQSFNKIQSVVNNSRQIAAYFLIAIAFTILALSSVKISRIGTWRMLGLGTTRIALIFAGQGLVFSFSSLLLAALSYSVIFGQVSDLVLLLPKLWPQILLVVTAYSMVFAGVAITVAKIYQPYQMQQYQA